MLGWRNAVINGDCLMHLDYLRDKRRSFPIIDDPFAIKSIRIWHCKYSSLHGISALINLEELVVASFPDASLAAISSLSRLRYIRIVHLPKITSLEPLGGLQHVESLSLSTLPTWDSSGKATVVKSLAPIASMLSLRHIELFGVRNNDGSLSDLEHCTNLRSARFSQYAVSEVERFFNATGATNAFIPPPSFERNFKSRNG